MFFAAYRARFGLLTKGERAAVETALNILDPVTKKFCSTCRHSFMGSSSNPKNMKCRSPVIARRSEPSSDKVIEHLVTGEPLPDQEIEPYYCTIARDHENLCGKRGRLWEAMLGEEPKR